VYRIYTPVTAPSLDRLRCRALPSAADQGGGRAPPGGGALVVYAYAHRSGKITM